MNGELVDVFPTIELQGRYSGVWLDSTIQVLEVLYLFQSFPIDVVPCNEFRKILNNLVLEVLISKLTATASHVVSSRTDCTFAGSSLRITMSLTNWRHWSNSHGQIVLFRSCWVHKAVPGLRCSSI